VIVDLNSIRKNFHPQLKARFSELEVIGSAKSFDRSVNVSVNPTAALAPKMQKLRSFARARHRAWLLSWNEEGWIQSRDALMSKDIS
jgi:hypothetical protein